MSEGKSKFIGHYALFQSHRGRRWPQNSVQNFRRIDGPLFRKKVGRGEHIRNTDLGLEQPYLMRRVRTAINGGVER